MPDPTGDLKQMVDRKREEVARAKAAAPMNEMEALVAQAEPARNFFSAVRRHPDAVHFSIIALIERRTPWAGPIRPEYEGEAFKPETIAREYHAHGAAAIAVSTDADFGGHLSHIERVKEAVPLPVLRVDTIIDPWQLWESRAAGADAVVLMAGVLREGDLIDMLILAQQLQLTVLLEAHDMDSLLRLRPHVGFPHAGYSLVGINNRDPETKKVDLAHTLRLADLVEDRSILVSGGGVRSRDDLLKLRALGVRIAIVGEYLLEQADPGAALADLLRPRLPPDKHGRAAR